MLLKSEGEAWDKRAEIRWKLWLREKPKMGRLMEVMLMVGDIVGTVQSET